VPHRAGCARDERARLWRSFRGISALLDSPRAGTDAAQELSQGPQTRIPFQREFAMLYWAAVFFVIALIAALFGFFGLAAGAAGIAKILFFVFIVLAVISLISGRRASI
jgi:uncharacterized membrane protein YtjA (UPF0391 family)